MAGLRDIIHRHNRLNGVVFSIVEFGLIGLFVGAFATWYTAHRRAGMAIIAWGIALNCLSVVIYGLRQLAQDRAKGKPIGSFWDRKSRARHLRENPRMGRDTLVLTVAALLPFAVLAALMFEVFRRPELRN